MLSKAMNIKRVKDAHRGDTIVEVLIAIAVAAFAIGTSYAIANRSLQQAVTARERNEAVNILQNQINALKVRYIYDKDNFYGAAGTYNFGWPLYGHPAPTAGPLPYTNLQFCLDPGAAHPDDPQHPNPDHYWPRINNSFSSGYADQTSNRNFENITPSSPLFRYNKGNGTNIPGCVITSSGTDYFVNIEDQITDKSKDSQNKNVYKITVRWAQAGSSGSVGESTIYYRL